MYRTFSRIIFAALLGLFVTSTGVAGSGDEIARKLLNSQGCKACHALEGDGGTLAVNFASMREKLSQDEIRLKLSNQTRTHANGEIPDFSHLSAQEIDALVNFIQPEQQ